MQNKPSLLVAVYRTLYRLPSETFIKEQAISLSRYRAVIWARDLTSLAKEENAELPCVSLIKPSRWSRALFTAFGWRSSAAETEQIPKLIHAHFGPDGAVVMPLARKMKVPLVLTCHGFDVQRSRWDLLKGFKPTNWIFVLREKKLYQHAACVIAVSEFLKKGLVRRGCPEDKIIVHYIGLDAQKFPPSSPTVREPLTLVHIGRHVPWKGVDTLLYALAVLKKTWPDILLLQAGGGGDTLRLKQLAEQLGVQNNVEWLGVCTQQQVRDALNRASIYVHPSRTDEAGQTEAFGITLLEAQATGLAVVASRSGGIPEAMSEGKTGLLFDEANHEMLAKQVSYLLENPALREQMSIAASNFVTTQFDIKQQTLLLESIYDDAVEKFMSERR